MKPHSPRLHLLLATKQVNWFELTLIIYWYFMLSKEFFVIALEERLLGTF